MSHLEEPSSRIREYQAFVPNWDTSTPRSPVKPVALLRTIVLSCLSKLSASEQDGSAAVRVFDSVSDGTVLPGDGFESATVWRRPSRPSRCRISGVVTPTARVIIAVATPKTAIFSAPERLEKG